MKILEKNENFRKTKIDNLRTKNEDFKKLVQYNIIIYKYITFRMNNLFIFNKILTFFLNFLFFSEIFNFSKKKVK